MVTWVSVAVQVWWSCPSYLCQYLLVL